MFGWIFRRAYRERAKLIAQNLLAASKLSQQVRDVEGALGVRFFNSENAEIFEKSVALAIAQAMRFASTHDIPQELTEPALQVNHFFRDLHASMTEGERRAAIQHGVSARIRSFEEEFRPEEGWRIFLAHGPSIRLKNQLYRLGLIQP